MAPGLDLLFKEGFLQSEVILLTEEMSHTTMCIFDGADWGTFHVADPLKVKSLLFQGLFKALRFAHHGCYFLWFSPELGTGVIH
jgi:hypothetical protein